MQGNWFYLAWGALFLAAFVLLPLGLAYVRELRTRVTEQDMLLRSLERDMQAICRGAKGMGDTVLALEQSLRQLTARQDSLDLREPDSQVYNHAIKLAHRGASVDELVASCGLVRSEAELLHLLHRRARGSRLAGAYQA